MREYQCLTCNQNCRYTEEDMMSMGLLDGDQMINIQCPYFMCELTHFEKIDESKPEEEE